jgi:hypothetical protein
VIPQGVEIYVATEPVDMRFGFERLGGLVRERMQREVTDRRSRDAAPRIHAAGLAAARGSGA